MNYAVIYMQSVREAIADHVKYLQNERVSSQTIEDWYERLFIAIDKLAEWPLRYPIAERESAARSIQLRKMNFGDYLVFYEVDAPAHVVRVLFFRHGARVTEDE